ncbi:HAD family hydrolase [Lacrimispora indolis]|uniref:HAD family hydrolase n=1 Tax=Lacrimispora indolis TaxID=69825 RepID=UPI00045E61D6|nr:HAD family hydrolase [Lacrimispora indolis]
MTKKLIIFTDSGDTIIDEETEIRDENGIVIHAELIPGAEETLKALYDSGYIIAMVADGEEQSFTNVYEENGLGYCFHTRTISQIVGFQKPSRLMFQDAMEKNHLTEEDKKRVVMIGNNVKKDIAGANRFGITSILIDWSPRYDMTPADEWERPDYTVHEPKELLALAERLEAELTKDGNV